MSVSFFLSLAIRVVIFYILFISILTVTSYYSSSPFVVSCKSCYIVDKVALYISVLFPPLLISAFLMKMIFKEQRYYSDSLVFVCYVFFVFFLYTLDVFWARGMEVDNKFFYAFLLFFPALTVFIVLQLVKIRQ